MKPPFNLSYDEHGDCLYIYGADDRVAAHSVEVNGVVIRYNEDDELIGITIVGPTDIRRPNS